MPVIKSSKKSMRQTAKRKARNYPVRNQLKTVYKKALQLVKDGKLEEAKKFLPFAYKVIDMATKKNLIHENNASHKKSRIALALNELEKRGGKVAAVTTKEDVKEAA
jgi:small subunit ribosomal protein S20